MSDPARDELRAACKRDDLRKVNALLHTGPCPRDEPELLEEVTAGGGSLRVAELLVDAGTRPTQAALLNAIRRQRGDQRQLVELLLSRGAKPDEPALCAAARAGNSFLLQLLLDEGGCPTPAVLADALSTGRGDVVALLLDRDAKTKRPHDVQKALDLLVERGADLRAILATLAEHPQTPSKAIEALRARDA